MLGGIAALLLDMDGVLTVSWKPVPGSVDAFARLRARFPVCVVTNNTTRSRKSVAASLSAVGFELDEHEVITSGVATAHYLRTAHPDAKCFVVGDGEPTADLDGVHLVDDNPDVVVLADAAPDWDFAMLNKVLGWLLDGAALVATNRNRYRLTDDGLEIDTGPFVSALEMASEKQAVVTGKPNSHIYTAGLSELAKKAGHRFAPSEVAMVGDDLLCDALGAQDSGLKGILARTGKYRPGVESDHGRRPDAVVDSLAHVPALLGLGGGK